MTVKELAEKLQATVCNAADLSRGVADGYAGDFLSFVMGKAPADCAWFTVMTNVNVCAVAVLCEVAAVVICEGCEPDAVLLQKAKTQGVNVLKTKLDVFHAIERVVHAD